MNAYLTPFPLVASSAAMPICPGSRRFAIFTDLLRRTHSRGKRVPDAWFAALAIESGCHGSTFDRDFARFPGLAWFVLGGGDQRRDLRVDRRESLALSFAPPLSPLAVGTRSPISALQTTNRWCIRGLEPLLHRLSLVSRKREASPGRDVAYGEPPLLGSVMTSYLRPSALLRARLIDAWCQRRSRLRALPTSENGPALRGWRSES